MRQLKISKLRRIRTNLKKTPLRLNKVSTLQKADGYVEPKQMNLFSNCATR